MAKELHNKCYLFVLFLLGYTSCAQGYLSLHLKVTKSQSVSGPEVEVSWFLPKPSPSLTLKWHEVLYTSQVNFKEIGNHHLDPSDTSYMVSDGLTNDIQYRFCLTSDDDNCRTHQTTCSYITVPSGEGLLRKAGEVLYMSLGPVNSRNVSVQWAEAGGPHQGVKGFKISWRRVDGRVGHPGHSTSLVTHKHLVQGLIPGTRYEICVSETLADRDERTCELITTAEDIPGPPHAGQSSCTSQARGTHWRCDVTWESPAKTHGQIIGYVIEWKDQEGYVLMMKVPQGSLCDGTCYEDQILAFHPHEVCVSARTRIGRGWEDCVPVHDVSTRILAFFELKVLLIMGITILAYQLGPKILKALCRCCINGLYRQMEPEKKHPV
ncbi:unnamed protein product [Meganyctiphanes norvegica]|uniref:Fibronectin type-III domain-containing protein n=1 Tax=Meganyctiphanes norvegica TaxID=48144 RepID=A0AAV2RC48_MEGNR